MQNARYFVFLGLMLPVCYGISVYTSPDCMSHSSNLKERYDDHGYRYETCCCRCSLVKNGKCVLGCRHKQVPWGTMRIIEKNTGKAGTNNLNSEPVKASINKLCNELLSGPALLVQKFIENRAS